MAGELSVKTPKAEKTAQRYFGAKASQYDDNRKHQPKWAAEETALRKVMADLPPGTKVLDIPCGTGRFFHFYKERRFRFWGEDISEDMLAEARKKAVTNCVRQGDIFKIDHAADVFDVTVTMRFMNLIKPPDVRVVLSELQRVSRRCIFGWREGNPDTSHYHDPHPINLIDESLKPGWKILTNEPMHQSDYRIIVLCSG